MNMFLSWVLCLGTIFIQSIWVATCISQMLSSKSNHCVFLVNNLDTPSYHLSLNDSNEMEHVKSEMIRDKENNHGRLSQKKNKQDDAIFLPSSSSQQQERLVDCDSICEFQHSSSQEPGNLSYFGSRSPAYVRPGSSFDSWSIPSSPKSLTANLKAHLCSLYVWPGGLVPGDTSVTMYPDTMVCIISYKNVHATFRTLAH